MRTQLAALVHALLEANRLKEERGMNTWRPLPQILGFRVHRQIMVCTMEIFGLALHRVHHQIMVCMLEILSLALRWNQWWRMRPWKDQAPHPVEANRLIPVCGAVGTTGVRRPRTKVGGHSLSHQWRVAILVIVGDQRCRQHECVALF